MAPSRFDCDDRDGGPGSPPSIDATLECLGHPLRRDVVGFCMGASDRTTDLDDLADRIVSAREGLEESVDRDHVAAALHHRHLPLLAEHGVIEFDPRSGCVRYHPDELVERWFERIRSEVSA